MYRSGSLQAVGNVTIPLSIFNGSDAAVFYSETDRNATFTVNIEGIDHGHFVAKETQSQHAKLRVTEGLIWSSVGVVLLALVAGFMYKKQAHVNDGDVSEDGHGIFDREEVFYLETPDVSTRKQQRRSSANVTPPKAAQRAAEGQPEDSEPFKLLDLLRAERRYWMSSRSPNTTIETAAPAAKPGWTWPYNQAKEWLSGSRSSSTDPTSRLDEATEVASVVTLHRGSDLDHLDGDPRPLSQRESQSDEELSVQGDNVSETNFSQLDESTNERNTPPQTASKALMTVARRGFDYLLPGATFSDSPRVNASEHATAEYVEESSGYIEVTSTVC